MFPFSPFLQMISSSWQGFPCACSNGVSPQFPFTLDPVVFFVFFFIAVLQSRQRVGWPAPSGPFLKECVFPLTVQLSPFDQWWRSALRCAASQNEPRSGSDSSEIVQDDPKAISSLSNPFSGPFPFRRPSYPTPTCGCHKASQHQG